MSCGHRACRDDQATTLKPALADVWNHKGTALLQLNHSAEASAAFKLASSDRGGAIVEGV